MGATSTATDLLDLAAEAACAAGRELLRRHGRAEGVGTKTSATDPVSDADRAAESLLVDILLGARPDDGVLGEEGADQRGSSGLRWVLDPLDGTVNYLYGFPGWCVSVACEDDDGALVGVVHEPATGETFRAARGRGGFLGERRLAVNEPVPLAHALIATGFAYDSAVRRRQGARVAALLPVVRDIRRAGSAALDLCWLAAGRVDAYYEVGPKPWDWAAAGLVARESGAVVGVYDTPDGRGVIAAGPSLYPALRSAVT